MTKPKTNNQDVCQMLADMKEQLDKQAEESEKRHQLMMERLDHALRENEQKTKKITELERRIEDLEQYSRIDDVIVSGIDVKYKSYARAAAQPKGEDESKNAEGLDNTEEELSVEQQVIKTLKNKGIHIDTGEISACHTLFVGKGQPRKIIIRFASRKSKIRVLSQGKKLKGSNIYINEHLTRATAKLAWIARQLRLTKAIENTWTRNCKVFAKLVGNFPEEQKVIMIRDISDFVENGIDTKIIDQIISRRPGST